MKHPATQLGIAIALLVIAFGAYGAWYAYVAMESARDASLDATIAAESNATVRAAFAQRSLAALTGRESEIDSRFVAIPNVVPFLQDLQNVGTREGAVVTVGSVSEEASPRAHLAIALNISGSFDAVMRTMGVIENGPYDIETTQSSLSEGGSSASAAWNASMTLSVGTQAQAASTTPSFFGTTDVAPPSSAPATQTTSASEASSTKTTSPHPAI